MPRVRVMLLLRVGVGVGVKVGVRVSVGVRVRGCLLGEGLVLGARELLPVTGRREDLGVHPGRCVEQRLAHHRREDDAEGLAVGRGGSRDRGRVRGRDRLRVRVRSGAGVRVGVRVRDEAEGLAVARPRVRHGTQGVALQVRALLLDLRRA